MARQSSIPGSRLEDVGAPPLTHLLFRLLLPEKAAESILERLIGLSVSGLIAEKTAESFTGASGERSPDVGNEYRL